MGTVAGELQRGQGYDGEKVLGPVQLRTASCRRDSAEIHRRHPHMLLCQRIGHRSRCGGALHFTVAVEEQQEALQDWYGSSDQDGSFPHLGGGGDVEAPMACLQMLARFYDLPFAAMC